MSREFGHHRLGTVVCSLSHILVAVAKAKEQVGQDVDNVGLKEPAEHGAQLREGKEAPLSVPVVLLVLQRLRQLGHDIQLLEGQDSKTLDETRKAVSSTFPLTKVLGVQ